ncbi:MAG: TRAP transporter small permease [Candidatus Odyssella sp.]|nr:TRAP transporter small permease [Candidatus Odyssella sp.]
MNAAAPKNRGLGRWLIDGPDTLAAAMLLALTVVTCVDVFGREVLRAPLKGADELTVVFMAISVYAVFGSITWRESHVCVDLVDMVWPKALTGARQIALNLVAAAFMGVVTWRVWIVAGRLAGDGEVTEYLRIPKGPLAYFFALMCAIAVLCLLANAVRYALGRGPLQESTSELEIGKHRID